VTEEAGRPVVVDASVAVKWVLVESLSDRAERLYEDCFQAQRPPMAPALLPNEVINAIYRQLHRGGLAERDADAAVARFARLSVWLLAPSGLPEDAYAFAKRHQLGAIYDALYVVLAQRLGAELWTDDLGLLSSVGTAAPWVRWIGDYPDG
jgi:predicted nucleic acid-binding protein